MMFFRRRRRSAPAVSSSDAVKTEQPDFELQEAFWRWELRELADGVAGLSADANEVWAARMTQRLFDYVFRFARMRRECIEELAAIEAEFRAPSGSGGTARAFERVVALRERLESNDNEEGKSNADS